MGLFKKIKDIFYDEEVIEEPDTKEMPKIQEIKVEQKTIEEKKDLNNTFSERELFKPERTFNFPVFDDEEEEEIKPQSKPNILELEKKRSYEEPKSKVVEEKKAFKPSPVISPIYGILDKNYKKEEVVEKKESIVKSYNNKELTYDYVRRKAYGSLEDELENTLTEINTEPVKTDEINEEEFVSKPSKNIEDLLSQIEQNIESPIGDVEEAIKDKMVDEEPISEKPVIEEPVEDKEKIKEEKNIDNTLEHDLFNLIDSMYEEKEGE